MVDRQRGFTLVELIVAITLLTVALLGLLGVNALVTRLLSSGNRMGTATFYAQERLENLRAQDCDNLTSGTDTREGIYQLSWSVVATPGGDARTVRLTASYPSRPGRIRVDTLETSVLCVN